MGGVCRVALACVLALGAVGLSAAAQDERPQAPLAHEWVAAASAFESYTSRAGAIAPGFGNGGDVSRAVFVGAAHEPQQLAAGMVAYAALAAVQEPAFVEAVQRTAGSPRERGELVHRLVDAPESVMGLPGADAAAGRARAALLRQIEPLVSDGRRVKQAAYDIQHRAWSKDMVTDGPARLARVKALSAQAFQPGDSDAERLFQAVTAQTTGSAGDAPTPVVTRGLALAALALLGAAGEETVADVRPLVSEAGGAGCMHMAKLNLFQCMAVAGPHYEDVFCLGEHAMIEPGQCMAKAAMGADLPAPVRQASVIPAAARPHGQAQ